MAGATPSSSGSRCQGSRSPRTSPPTLASGWRCAATSSTRWWRTRPRSPTGARPSPTARPRRPGSSSTCASSSRSSIAPRSGRGRARPAATERVDEPRYRLTVHDRLNTRLVGRRSISYTSPPQPYDEALVLAGILLDRPEGLSGAGPWFRPIAGGQRTVSLEVVEDITPAQLHLEVTEP